MNILFTLCGRAGSKGVKGKNARDFLDVPLVWYSMAGISLYIKRHVKPEDHVDVVLNTDSRDLMRLVAQVKDLEVALLERDVSLGGDRVPKVAVILDCLTRAKAKFGVDYDMIVDLDITSPLRTVQDVKNAVDRKAARTDVDVVYSVAPARRNPYFNMVKEENGFFCQALPSNYTSRQQAPVFYDMNASIYAYSTKALETKEQDTFFNDRCDAILMADTGVLDIDSEEDYELMQVIARYLFEKKPAYKEIFDMANSWKK